LTETTFSEVYVLTIPSFRWVQISDENNIDILFDQNAGRTRVKCDIWNERQMIVTGGIASDGGLQYNSLCNSSYPPMKVLDTSTYVWQTEFSPNNTSYTVPQAVFNVIGGT